ncbi:MAG: ATP-grasp domain-containing protein [Archangium sp.]
MPSSYLFPETHEAFVIDIAETPNGLRIVELNTFNSAGFCAADVQRLVIAVEDGDRSSASNG